MNVSLLLIPPIVRVVAILFWLGAISAPLCQAQVSFFTPPTYAGVGTIFVADFNGDGKPDILASDGTLNLGNGDGTFTTGTPVTGTPLAVADFNGDGRPDVLEQATGTLLVLLGNGDGTFQPPIITNSGASLFPVIVGDLTGNGKADVLGLFNNNLVVYLSNGDGTFAAGVSYSVGNTSSSFQAITLGDFNGDGKVDVAVSLSAVNVGGQEVVFLGNGDGTFQSGKTSTGIEFAAAVVAGDFNSDGKLDLVIAGQTDLSNITSILLGNGDGTFQAPTTLFSNSGTLATADVNGDGKLDLVLLNGVVAVYLGKGDGTFSNTHSYQSLGGGGGLAVADFNLDGKLDIAAGNLLLGNGDGTFKGVSGVALSLPQYGPPATVVGDFNKDGAPDVAVLSANSTKNLYILINDGTGALNLANTYTLQEPGYGIAAADLNGDGNLDLVVVSADPINWSYSVLLGNGDGSFQPPVFYPQNVFGETPAIVIADFNNDHKPDFAVTAGNSAAVLLGKGDGTFGAPAYFFDGGGDEGGGSIVSADLNGDGKQDIAAAGPGSAGLAILLGNGDGTFQAATFPFTTPFSGLLTADVNGDGKADLVSTFGAQVYLGNGNGTFQAPIPIVSTSTVIASVLADINRDGKLDLIGGRQISTQSGDRGIFLGNGDGTFGPYILLPFVFSEDDTGNFVQAADMNGDGKQDLIVAQDPYSIFVLINTTVPVPGASFSPTSVNFPSQTVETVSNPTPVMLTNTGAVALTVKSVSFGGVDAGEFKQTNNCTTVEPLESCTIKVSFAPTATGGSSANLIVGDNAGAGSQQVVVSGTGTAAPGFAIAPASGSSDSGTIAAGQTASFNLAITPAGSFSGTVSLTCAITPAVMPAPVCSVPASVNVTQGTAAAVTAKISTTAAGTAGSISQAKLPSGMMPIAATFFLLSACLLVVGYRRRMPALAVPITAVLLFGVVACGGSSSHGTSTPGTPAGTYTATVTAKSGSLSENSSLTVVVQ